MTTAELGDRVHYVAHGTPPHADGTQTYPSVCRAAFVTDYPPQIPEEPIVLDLFVVTPTGSHHNRAAHSDDLTAGGTWHFACQHHLDERETP